MKFFLISQKLKKSFNLNFFLEVSLLNCLDNSRTIFFLLEALIYNVSLSFTSINVHSNESQHRVLISQVRMNSTYLWLLSLELEVCGSLKMIFMIAKTNDRDGKSFICLPSIISKHKKWIFLRCRSYWIWIAHKYRQQMNWCRRSMGSFYGFQEIICVDENADWVSTAVPTVRNDIVCLP